MERWFDEAGVPPPFDLARSGAPPRTVREILGVAATADVAQYLDMSLDYGSGSGSDRLRSAIASYVGATADEVVVTHGAIEALVLACAACVGERHRVAVAVPAYEGLLRSVEAAGGRPEPVTVWRPGAVELDLSGVLALDLRRYAAVLLNTPHNPTGLTVRADELAALGERCTATGTVLVVDEVSRGTLDPAAPSVRRSLPVGVPSLVEIGDVSKSLGLGGLRVGWCVASDGRRRARVVALRHLTSLSNSGLTQHLAAVALERRQCLSATACARANRERLAAALARVPGARWVPPLDGLVAFAGLPLPCPSVDFAAHLRAAAGVAVAPGAFFGHDDHVRLGLGVDGETFDHGLERLVALLVPPGVGVARVTTRRLREEVRRDDVPQGKR